MSAEKSTDPRFAGIYSDPKFKSSKSKDYKVKLDSRFGKRDLQIKRKSKVDKYGRPLGGQQDAARKDIADFDRYFEKQEDEADSKIVDRARGEVTSDYVSSSDELTSSDSETSGESDLDDEEESEVKLEQEEAETGEVTDTLAVVNLDWDHVKSSDLMVTFVSFVPKGKKIKRIAIYPSEFGKERMQREEVEGPPKELFRKTSKKSSKNSEDSDSDIDIKDLYEEGDADKQVDSKALRQYQLDRLRYYYAVVYCDSKETAESIYKNCDGTEYESTANIFDLRYVPEGMTFDDEARDECSSMPKNYKPHQFSTDALQHSNVKLTWDETPVDRVEIAKRAFTQKEIEDMDFKAYLASDSDESEAEINEDARSKLKALVGGFSKKQNNGDEDEEEEVDMEITFTPGLENDTAVETNEAKDEESTIDKIKRKEKERRKARKEKLKQLKQKAAEEKKLKLKSKAPLIDGGKESKSAAELELLMMADHDEPESKLNKKAHFNMNEILRSEKEKTKKSKYQDKHRIVEDTFKPDLNDPRFREVFESHDFAIDPSQPEFKGTKAMREILEERRHRSAKHKAGRTTKRPSNDTENAKEELSGLVKKLKRKTKKQKL